MMKMDTRCLMCHFRKNLDMAEKQGTQEQAMEFARGLMEIYLRHPADVSSLIFGPEVTALFGKIYGAQGDRFRREKEESNAFVMERMALLEETAENAEDPVYAGLQLAILGNYIDFSALYGEVSFEKLDEMIRGAMKMELDRGVYQQLLADLETAKNLLYLTDNAGEIGFDRVFARQIQRRFPQLNITFCVRGGPTLNDATREDAAAVGIEFPVIDNGNTIPGTALEYLGADARRAMEGADVILAKGQANAETLLDSGYPVYYAFLVKCIRFMERFDSPKLTPMLVREGQWKNQLT